MKIGTRIKIVEQPMLCFEYQVRNEILTKTYLTTQQPEKALSE